MSITKRLDSKQKNIDAIIDTLLDAQKEAGLETHMREVLFDPSTNERINRFHRARLEREGVDLSAYGNSVNGGCAGCSKDCGKKTLSNIERGVFVYNEDDLFDDTDDLYICEFCTGIGFDQKYKPEICDQCEECLTCRQYINGECDGCGYSTAYNGTRYGAVQDVEVDRNEQDESLLEEISGDTQDDEIHYPDGRFTIMDY